MRPRRLSLAATLGTCAALAACTASTRVTVFDPALRLEPRTPPEAIRLYDVQLPQCPFTELGRVTAERGDGFVSWDQVVRALRERAHEMGGDAVVRVREGHGGGSNVILAKDPASAVIAAAGSGSADIISGTVIRFTDADCTS